MKAVVCLRHPQYVGQSSPDLKCKACCAIFVLRVKSRNQEQLEDIESWLESKSAKESITWNV